MANLTKIMPIALIAMYGLSAYYMIDSRIDSLKEYNYYLNSARKYAEQGVLVDAFDNYESALNMNPTADLYLEAGNIYLENEELYDAKQWYENNLLSKFPKEAETYEYGIRVYKKLNQTKEAISCYQTFQELGLESESVEKEIAPILYTFSAAGQFDDVTAFSNVTGTAAVKIGDLWGYVDENGYAQTDFIYKYADVFSDYAAVTKENGEACYIDQEQNTRITTKQILENDPDFGQIVQFKGDDNYIIAFNGKIWNFYDSENFKKLFGGFSDVTLITNGVGGVADSSGKWALIDQNGNLQTEYIYDEVLYDNKGIACRTNGILVRSGNEYYLVDHKGNKISESYSQAKAFNDSTYAAVEKNGAWIMIDENGKEYDFGSYEEMESFSNGLAAVRNGNLWGYINEDQQLCIDYQFSEARPFSATGAAFVKGQSEESSWTVIYLYKDQV